LEVREQLLLRRLRARRLLVLLVLRLLMRLW
jgi:hypothetical protein